MAETLSLLEFIQRLFTDEELRELFNREPDQALEQHGLSDLSEADVRDALVLVDDSQTADFSRDYDTGGNSIDWSDSDVGSHNRYDGDGGGHDGDHDGGHQAAVEHLSRFVTNNFIDDRDTTVDNSINQQIDNRGGIFDQDLDVDSNVASGDGAVATDDVSGSNIVTGDENLIGDDNIVGDGNITGDNAQVVSGDGNTTSFGEGDASSVNVGDDLTLGDGSGFATGGSSVGIDNSDNSIEDSGNTDNSVEDSFNTRIEDSFQDNSETEVNQSSEDNDDFSSTVETRVERSENVDIDN